MAKKIDWSLYLVTDKKLSRGRPLDLIVQEAIDGGITALQIREKKDSTARFVQDALRLRVLTEEAGIPLIVNDRVDVALAIAADGVHLGQDDLPYQFARKLLGPKALIGISVTNVEQARRAQEWDLAYIGVGPIFFTMTKEDGRPAIGYEGLQSIAAVCTHTVVAIGGIKTENVSRAIEAGACGVSVVSSIVAADHPRQATQELINVIRRSQAQFDRSANGQ